MSNDITLQEKYRLTPFSIEEIGRHGSGRVSMQIHGYWSSDPISLYIDRRFSLKDEWQWTVALSHSSGGRDTDQQHSDIVAGRCLAAALEALCDMADTIENQFEQLEVFYQQRQADDAAERAAKEAAKQKLIEADAPLGENGAKAVLSFLEGKARQQLWVEHYAVVLPRGAETGFGVSAKFSGDRTTFRYKGNVISRKALLEELSNASHRTTV